MFKVNNKDIRTTFGASFANFEHILQFLTNNCCLALGNSNFRPEIYCQ